MSYELIVHDHHFKSEITEYEYYLLTQENRKKYRKKADYQGDSVSGTTSTNDYYNTPVSDYGSSNNTSDDNSFSGFGGGSGGGAGAGGSWDSDSGSSNDSSSYDSGSSDSGSSSSD